MCLDVVVPLEAKYYANRSAIHNGFTLKTKVEADTYLPLFRARPSKYMKLGVELYSKDFDSTKFIPSSEEGIYYKAGFHVFSNYSTATLYKKHISFFSQIAGLVILEVRFRFIVAIGYQKTKFGRLEIFVAEQMKIIEEVSNV